MSDPCQTQRNQFNQISNQLNQLQQDIDLINQQMIARAQHFLNSIQGIQPSPPAVLSPQDQYNIIYQVYQSDIQQLSSQLQTLSNQKPGLLLLHAAAKQNLQDCEAQHPSQTNNTIIPPDDPSWAEEDWHDWEDWWDDWFGDQDWWNDDWQNWWDDDDDRSGPVNPVPELPWYCFA